MKNGLGDKSLLIYNEAGSSNSKTLTELAVKIADKKTEAFCYEENDEKRYCAVDTIKDYINFLRVLEVLAEDIQPLFDTKFNSPKDFLLKLGKQVVAYLGTHNLTSERLSEISRKLLKNEILPTMDNFSEAVAEEAGGSVRYINWCVKVLYATGKIDLKLSRKWIWIPDNFQV